MDVRRTIVFQEEINEFVNLIIKEDKVKFQLTKNIKIKSNIRAVFILLLYYSGLRKTELRTRMLNDIYMLDEETFVIDVNSKGFRETMKSTGETELKLKTSNARRRIKFKISDRNHLHIVKSYLRFLEERQFKFLFPAFSSQSHNLLKKYNLGIITQEVYNNEKDKLKVIIGYISNVIHNYNNIVAYHLKCLEFYYNTIKDLDYTIGTTVEKINNLEKENN
jgi:radical SAM superfamily enzyme YgiQ (UPF0313 family)